MIYIFLGAPGSGKGTQSKMLQKHLGIVSISTGDALRSEILNKSEIGIKAKSFMDSGMLVPDDVVIDIIKSKIKNVEYEKGFILDGFPRTEAQAKVLDNLIKSLDKKIDKVFNFEVSDDVLIKRISGRFSCKKCGALYNHYFKTPNVKGVCDDCNSTEFESRLDDNEQTVKQRLEVYRQTSLPLIEFYKKKNLIVSLDASKISSLIFENLISSIKNNKQ